MKTPESRDAAQREYDNLTANYSTAITTFGRGDCTDPVDKALVDARLAFLRGFLAATP